MKHFRRIPDRKFHLTPLIRHLLCSLKLPALATLCYLLIALSGCATTTVRDPDITAHAGPLTLDYCMQSSSEINTVKETLSETDNKQEFKRHISIALNDVRQTLEANLIHTPDINITALSACPENTTPKTLTSDFILTIEISGYGSIKKEWKTILIGTGIAEGLFQGLAVSAATQNPWLGVAVAAEEIGSEFLTWNGVDWILGDTYAPVTLEGTLLYPGTHETLWQDSAFVTENDAALSSADKKNKFKQLEASLHKAELELISSLNHYLQTEILKIPDVQSPSTKANEPSDF